MKKKPIESGLLNLKINRKFHLVIIYLLSSLFFILLTISCQDGVEEIEMNQYDNLISSVTAEMVALKFNPNTTSKQGKYKTTNKKIKENKEFFSKKDNLSFYVINFVGGGYCIVSADTRMHPILAYSQNNKFNTNPDNFPPNLKIWIEYVYNSVDKLIITNPAPNEISTKMWNSYTSTDLNKEPPGGGCEEYDFIKGPLMTTKWHQECTFNDLLPTMSCGPCGKAHTGCVTTAMGQIMKYHGHPSSYSWSNMPDTTGTSATQTLMYDIFNDVIETYNCSASSVYDYHLNNVVSSFENDYNYDSSVTLTSYDRFDIEDEIDANRPVLMSGSSSTGGHSWVIDGYHRTLICVNGYGYGYLKFSMNWGGAGLYDGWYNYDDFTPGTFNFNHDQQMIIGIKP